MTPPQGEGRGERTALVLQSQLLLEVMDVHSTGLEVRVSHDVGLQRMLVLMPSITISESAVRMRAIATARVSPCVISLPIIES